MLRNLVSTLPNFKAATFQAGLNIAVAHRTKVAQAQDSRNAVGKTSFVTVLDFLLGATADKNHLLRRAELKEATFGLTLDFAGDQSRVTRNGKNFGTVNYAGQEIRLKAWCDLLGQELFGLSGNSVEPNYRSLIAFYLRSVEDGGFLAATETHKKQRALDTQSPLVYLFGLDNNLVVKAREITDAQRSLRELRKAAQDPVLGMTLGRAPDLDAEIRTLRIQEERLGGQLSDFRVVEGYADKRREADEASRQIRRINDRLVMAERRLKDIEQAIDAVDERQPDHGYLRDVYGQVGLILPDEVVRRFDEVEAFHQSVVSNRRRYLESERARLAGQLNEDHAELVTLDDRRADAMRILQQGGALDTFNELQRELAEITGRITELSERRQTVDRWENGNRHLQLQAAELELQVSTDLQERRAQIDSIAQMYSGFAYRLYGKKRPASLTIEATRNGYRFLPTIGGDRSEGVRSMALFCFDLTLAVTACRAGNGPDFLVHDSHLFDGVEARQVAGALQLAAEVTERENMQYIATINSDDLNKALREDATVSFHQCAEMTDKYDDGGLFGIRFN